MRHIEGTNRNTAKKGVMAAAALFVALAALPALAETPQEMVVNRLSSETSETVQSGKTTSQTSRGTQHGTCQEKVISRIASQITHVAGSNSLETEEALRSGGGGEVSQYIKQKQRDIQAHLHGS
ncbi:hypothetical protein [Geomonas propionica]|uniref:Uncharacterized protein n=1 Tax=Geomonas propionica TaxID=2798582 RepID=A0ABS0YLH2_9BACT|nr:hypothetical protein [Geomonas propionica]MBJ6798799.1 hypothetical protein [Geomonas propionica]